MSFPEVARFEAEAAEDLARACLGVVAADVFEREVRGCEGVVFSAVLALVARGSSTASAVLARSWSSVCSR